LMDRFGVEGWREVKWAGGEGEQEGA
jgi:hypothetical protein